MIYRTVYIYKRFPTFDGCGQQVGISATWQTSMCRTSHKQISSSETLHSPFFPSDLSPDDCSSDVSALEFSGPYDARSQDPSRLGRSSHGTNDPLSRPVTVSAFVSSQRSPQHCEPCPRTTKVPRILTTSHDPVSAYHFVQLVSSPPVSRSRARVLPRGTGAQLRLNDSVPAYYFRSLLHRALARIPCPRSILVLSCTHR